MTTLSPVIFITSGNLLVISVAINNEVSAAKYGIAFAYCSVLIAIVLLGIGLITLLLPSRRRFAVPQTTSAARLRRTRSPR
jgi:iron(III) transport system permease protein